MSEFQQSLLVIARLVVVAVYAYGYWQQWRYRRSLDRGDAEPRATQRAVVPEAAVTAQPAEEPADHFIADKPAAEACDLLDDKLDYIVSMTPKFPVSAEALEAFWPRRFDYGKTIQTCGCNADTGAWERVIPESPASVASMRARSKLAPASADAPSSPSITRALSRSVWSRPRNQVPALDKPL
jgi:hypothetical protein